MHGLPQADRIANEQIKEHLDKFRYQPTQQTPSLWKYDSKPITFVLWVDNFGVKYVSMSNVRHLQNELEK